MSHPVRENPFKTALTRYCEESTADTLITIARRSGDAIQWGLPPLAMLHAGYKAYEGDLSAGKIWAGSIFVSWLAATIAKEGFSRLRPDQTGVETTNPEVNSFFSRHSAVAFACATYALLNALPQGVVASLYALAAFTGFSRVVADRHHPTDVLAGAGVGTFISLAMNKSPSNTIKAALLLTLVIFGNRARTGKKIPIPPQPQPRT